LKAKALEYTQQGIKARGRGDFEVAETNFKKALTIFQELKDEPRIAEQYFHLGKTAQDRSEHNFSEIKNAKMHYEKALSLFEKLNLAEGMAVTTHNLGVTALLQRDFPVAEELFLRSLHYKKLLNDEHSAAFTYQRLGMLAQRQGEYSKAEDFYRLSLALVKKYGDEHSAGQVYGQLGDMNGECGHFENAGICFINSIIAFLHTNDEKQAQRSTDFFFKALYESDVNTQKNLRNHWEQSLGSVAPLEELEKLRGKEQ